MTPCGPTWHRLANPGGEPLWFSLGVRIRDKNGTYVYRLGPKPDDAACRTIWCFDGKPWTCAACGKVISAKRYRPDSPEPARKPEAFRIPVPVSGRGATRRSTGTDTGGPTRPDAGRGAPRSEPRDD